MSKDSEHLQWIHDRLANVHREPLYVDYMWRLREIIEKRKLEEQLEENKFNVPSWWPTAMMCKMGFHWSGIADGGGMGDAMRCDHCGHDKYPESFNGWLLHVRK